MSFGHSTLSFADDGFIKVSGINENPNDLATSNGSGKSSLWESIIWALTGETIRGTKQVANIYGQDGTYVELEFDIDNHHYFILRAKEHKEYKTSLKIVVDGKDCSGKGIRDSEKLLAEYLPDITSSLLGSVIILGQGLPQKFTNNSPSGRKEVLEILSKSDFMIEDLKKRISVRKDELNKLIRQLQDTAISNRTKRNTLQATYDQNLTTLSSLNKNILLDKQSKLQTEFDSLSCQSTELESIIAKLMEEELELHKQVTALDVNRANIIQQIQQEASISINSLTVTINSNKSYLHQLQDTVKKMSSIQDVCPTCKQKIIGVVKPDTTELECQIAELHTLIDSDTTKLTNIKQSTQQAITDATHEVNIQKKKLVDELAIISTELTTKKDTLFNCNSSLTKLSKEISEVNIEIAQLDTKQQTLLSQNEAILREIEDIENLLLYNNNEELLQQSHLEVVNKFDTAVKRDFRGHLLSNIIEYIQQRAKQYCKTIFETDKVQFYLEGNNIHISYMDKEYENLSGGEKQKIDLIVQFSIRDMLTNYLGFTSNILVLDEVFDGLDMIGCQKVIDVISDLSDVKNIFIVTHRKDLAIPSDKELIVVKSEYGISEIR